MKKLIMMLLVLVLGLTLEVAKADFTFGTPTNLGPTVNGSVHDLISTISGDGLELYFTSNRSGGKGGNDIWLTTRVTKDDNWGEPVNLDSPVNSSYSETSPSISADGLTLYFSDFGVPRPGGIGDVDIWVTTRPTKDDEWREPVNLVTVNSGARDGGASISDDGLELFFYSNRSGGYGFNDIWVAKRSRISEAWGTPENLGQTVNTSSGDCCPSISSDGRMLFFASDRSGGSAGYDLWMTTRATKNSPWRQPVNLGPSVNTSFGEDGASISVDGLSLFFNSNRSNGFGNEDLWQVSITPVIDFNGDGIVDASDTSIMVDHWGEDYSLCDIGPMPWGDGIVDVEDLQVLAEHLFEEVNDPTLIAHWPLDETEGMVVTDSAGYNDGYALGDPTWQPESGIVNGALQLDGVDDYVVTGAASNPEGAAFSVLAWIKGGAQGQVVLSQMGKTNWLCTDPSEGFLMTELTMIGGNSGSLGSEAVITDGNWHRIGFVWDGSNRRLYVDGVVVAEDEQDNLDISVNGLYFGTGKAMEPNTFWAGLIDDVRIYNRAVSP